MLTPVAASGTLPDAPRSGPCHTDRVRDEIELIEILDADPSAFGPAPRAAGERPSRRATREPRRPAFGTGGTADASDGDASDGDASHPTGSADDGRLWKVLVGLVLVGAVAALLVWSPWRSDDALVLADPRREAAALTERLVFDPPPAELRSVALGTVLRTERSAWNSRSTGYFFAVPGATFDPDDGDDRWFGFYALPSDDPSAPLVFGRDRIAGAPAEVADESGGNLVDLAWGPVGGYTFAAAGSQMSIDEAIAVAEQLRIVDGRPVVLEPDALGDMRPLGPFGDYVVLATLLQYASDNGAPTHDVTGLYYGFAGQSVVSMPGDQSVFDLVPFVLSPDAEERTVRGRRAVGFTKGAGPFGGFDRSTVLWWEDGRVVQVAGDGDLSATFDLAETVRPATDEEWADVEAVSRPQG